MMFGIYHFMRAEAVRRAMLRQTLRMITTIQGAPLSDENKKALNDQVVSTLIESYSIVRWPFIVGLSGSEAIKKINPGVCSDPLRDACAYAHEGRSQSFKDCPAGDTAMPACKDLSEYENFLNGYCNVCE